MGAIESDLVRLTLCEMLRTGTDRRDLCGLAMFEVHGEPAEIVVGKRVAIAEKALEILAHIPAIDGAAESGADWVNRFA